jgi:hypothetical protein
MLPNSAGAPTPSTCTSSMVSGLIAHQAEPVSGAEVSSPSTCQAFDCMLEPKAICRSLPSLDWETPGDTAIRS